MKLRTNLRRVFIILVLVWSSPDVWSLIIGSGLVILAQLIHFVSAGYLVKQKQLTMAGPYRFTRNPFYLGNFLSDLGLILIAQNPWLGVIYLVIFYLIIIPRRITKEEQSLAAKFGSAYLAYSKTVPRFIPRLWPAKLNNLLGDPKSQERFAWERITRYRELWRVIRILGIIGIFYLQYDIGYSFLGNKPQWSRLTSETLNVVLLVTLTLILVIPPIWEYGFRKGRGPQAFG